MIKCDLCGGSLMMDAGGKYATCQSCGMDYSIERVKELFNATNPHAKNPPEASKSHYNGGIIDWERVGHSSEERNPNELWRTEDFKMNVSVSQTIKRRFFSAKIEYAARGSVINGEADCFDWLITDAYTGREYYLKYAEKQGYNDYKLVFATNHFSKRTYPVPTPGNYIMERKSFVHALEDACPDCTIRYQVPAAAFGAADTCMPVDYLIIKNQKPVLAICVHDGNNYRSKRAALTRQAVECGGIGYMRFFSGMPNDPSYVTRRVKSALEARR